MGDFRGNNEWLRVCWTSPASRRLPMPETSWDQGTAVEPWWWTGGITHFSVETAAFHGSMAPPAPCLCKMLSAFLAQPQVLPWEIVRKRMWGKKHNYISFDEPSLQWIYNDYDYNDCITSIIVNHTAYLMEYSVNMVINQSFRDYGFIFTGWYPHVGGHILMYIVI